MGRGAWSVSGHPLCLLDSVSGLTRGPNATVPGDVTRLMQALPPKHGWSPSATDTGSPSQPAGHTGSVRRRLRKPLGGAHCRPISSEMIKEEKQCLWKCSLGRDKAGSLTISYLISWRRGSFLGQRLGRPGKGEGRQFSARSKPFPVGCVGARGLRTEECGRMCPRSNAI